jgi:transposase-like protein
MRDMTSKGRHRLQRRPHLVAGERNPASKLTDAERSEIARRYKAGESLQRELAAEFGVSQRQVSNIVRRWLEPETLGEAGVSGVSGIA